MAKKKKKPAKKSDEELAIESAPTPPPAPKPDPPKPPSQTYWVTKNEVQGWWSPDGLTFYGKSKQGPSTTPQKIPPR